MNYDRDMSEWPMCNKAKSQDLNKHKKKSIETSRFTS